MIQITNLPEGDTIFMAINNEQWELILRLKDLGVFIPDVVIEEIDVEKMY